MNERPSDAIRRATERDADALGAMRAAQQIEIGGSLEPADREAYVRRCRAFFGRELAVSPAWLFAWIAEDGAGAAAGVSVLTLAPGMPRTSGESGPDGRIRNVYVLPAFRGRGLGRMLTRTAIDAAERFGVSRLALGASTMGRSMYESLGFVSKGDEMTYAPFARR
jgi:GNAT superfamily N-acetyltransferase